MCWVARLYTVCLILQSITGVFITLRYIWTKGSPNTNLSAQGSKILHRAHYERSVRMSVTSFAVAEWNWFLDLNTTHHVKRSKWCAKYCTLCALSVIYNMNVDFLYVSRTVFQGTTVGNNVDTRNLLMKQEVRNCESNMCRFSVMWNLSHLKLQMNLFTNCNVQAVNSLRIPQWHQHQIVSSRVCITVRVTVARGCTDTRHATAIRSGRHHANYK